MMKDINGGNVEWWWN